MESVRRKKPKENCCMNDGGVDGGYKFKNQRHNLMYNHFRQSSRNKVQVRKSKLCFGIPNTFYVCHTIPAIQINLLDYVFKISSVFNGSQGVPASYTIYCRIHTQRGLFLQIIAKMIDLEQAHFNFGSPLANRMCSFKLISFSC